MGIGPEMIMQARNMPLPAPPFFWLNTLALGLCVKFLKGHPHAAQVPCGRDSPFLLRFSLGFFLGDR